MIIGITGEIGSGKTFVSECFKKLGAAIFNADSIVNHLYKEDKKIKNYAKKNFPEVIINERVNKLKLSKHFLSYDEKWVAFESLVHCAVLQKLKVFLAREREINRKFVILDIPLLLEKKIHFYCDAMIFVYVSQAIRYQRLNRRSINKEKLKLIQKIQTSAELKRKLSSFIINTGTNRGYVFLQVKEIINILSTRIMK
ncbi:MAG: dephospho-CoA kinase [Wolbachia endosymbiont of Fragariocoptes setiger]|nr:dephospho-CoA kinase [Wolbachia endosymbiont of Fragariocoptes setiger]